MSTETETSVRTHGKIISVGSWDDAIRVCATQLSDVDDAVSIQIGRLNRGEFCLWLSVSKARGLADALIAASDHYDAETARLAELANTEAAAELEEAAA